jgi:hypothetical protein
MQINVRLREKVTEERRVIHLLRKEANISDVVRAALIQYYGGAGLSNGILNDKLDKIIALLESGAVATGNAQRAAGSGAAEEGDEFDYLNNLGL